jgi:hypothetical protein
MKNRNRHAQVMDAPLPSRDCLDCYEPIAETETAFYWETSEDEQFWINAPKTEGPVCEACWVKRDNREGPEPDGEAFRGGEAAAFRAEEQARIQRELK